MSANLGICLERPSALDRASGKPLWGDMGQVLRRTLQHYGINADECIITYVLPDPKVTGERIALVKPQIPRIQQELAGVRKILCCGAMSLAAVQGLSAIPTKYHKVRGRGQMTAWGEPAKFVVPTYSIQQVWAEPDYARDLYFDVQKIVHQDAPQPEPIVKTVVVQTVDELRARLQEISQASIIACDIETGGLDPLVHTIDCIGFGVLYKDNGAHGLSIVVPRHLLQPKNQYVCGLLLQFLGPRSPYKGTIIWQNYPFDAQMLREYLDDWPFHPNTTDTLMLNYSCDERPIGRFGVHSLKDMSRIRFDNEYGFDWETFLPLPVDERPYDDLYAYNGLDCFVTAKLYEILSAEMAQEPGLDGLVQNLLMPASRALAQVARKGMLLDQDYLRSYRSTLDGLVAEREKALKEYAAEHGMESLSPASSQQVAQFLYGVLELPMPRIKLKRKKPGDWSTCKAALDKVRRTATEEQRTFIDHLLAYRLYDKTRSTYVDALLTKVSVDGRIHPNLALAGTVTGRLACVAKGTLVEIVRDVSTYPTGVPIEDVRVGDLAYTYDENRRLTLRPVVWSGKTGHRPVLRLHWLGTGRRHRGYVDVTPDHLVRRVDGTYVAAEQLRPGDRVMALHRGETMGYSRLYATGYGDPLADHRFIASTLHGDHIPAIHHRNSNRLDNRVENLLPIAADEHTRLHNVGKKYRPCTLAKLSEAGRRRWAAGRHIGQTGTKAWNYLALDATWMTQVLWDNAGRPTAFRDIYGIDYTTAMRYLRRYGIDWKTIRACFTSDGTRITKELVEQGRSIYTDAGQRSALAFMGMNYYRFKALQEQHGFIPYNHMITAVEHLPDSVDVYDVAIEGTHNFIANEINVHNSWGPNLQNQPVHTGKDLRRGFVAAPGYTLVEADHKNLELRVAAWFSQEPVLVDAFARDADLHQATAAKVFNKPYEDVTGHERFLAKAVNFGLLFGRSAEALAEGREMDEYEARGGTRWTLEIARQFHDDYLNSMPVLKKWIETHVAECLARKYTLTPFGRRRRFPLVLYHNRSEIERQITNTVIQSTASDITLEGAIRLVDALPEGANVILLIHDAILCEVRDDLVSQVKALMKEIMEHTSLPERGVPWRVDIHTAKNWADLKD